MKIRWTRLALSDIQHAYDYLQQRDPSTIPRISERISKALTALSQFPEMGHPGRVVDTREFVILSTPFILVYRYRSLQKQIEVLAFLHHARKWPD